MKIPCRTAAMQLWNRLVAHPLMRIHPLVGYGVKKLPSGDEAIYVVVSSRDALQVVPDDFRGYPVTFRVANETSDEQ